MSLAFLIYLPLSLSLSLSLSHSPSLYPTHTLTLGGLFLSISLYLTLSLLPFLSLSPTFSLSLSISPTLLKHPQTQNTALTVLSFQPKLNVIYFFPFGRLFHSRQKKKNLSSEATFRSFGEFRSATDRNRKLFRIGEISAAKFLTFLMDC